MTNVRRRKMDHSEEVLQAKAKAEKLRLGPATRPGPEPPLLPDDLTILADADLIDLMAQFTRWADYSQTQLAMAEIDEEVAEQLLSKARSLALLECMPSKEELRKGEVTMTEVKAEVEARDENYGKYSQMRLEAYAFRKLLMPRYEAYVRGQAIVSRELTRRTDREGPSRRDSRWVP